MTLQGTPINKKLSVDNLFNYIPSAVAFNSAETVSADGALTLGKTIHLLSGATATAQTTLADGTLTWSNQIHRCYRRY